MKPISCYQIALLAVIMAGAAAGYFSGRSSSPAAGGSKDGQLPTAANSPSISTNGAPLPHAHPAAELDAWLRIADHLSAADGLGFDPAWDAPGLLLSMEKLTAADFPALLQTLAARPDSIGRKRLEAWLVEAWSRRRPREAFAWAEEHRRDLWNAALEELARVNPAAAWEKLKVDPSRRLPPGEMEGVHSVLFETWARMDRPAALRALAELCDTISDHGNEGIVACEGFWKGALPDRAKFPDEWRRAVDPLAREIVDLTEGATRSQLLGGLMYDYRESQRQKEPDPESMARNRQEVADWLKALPLDETMESSLLQSLAQREGVAAELAPSAYAWLWGNVPASQRAETLNYIVSVWAAEEPWSARDPDGCGKWLNSLGPLGPEFSKGLKQFAEHAAARDPEAGLAWAGRIADPSVKKEATTAVAELIRRQWPDRAEALLGKQQ